MVINKKELEKRDVSLKALSFLPKKGVIGLGSGTTIDTFSKMISKKSLCEFVCVSKNAKKVLKSKGLKLSSKNKVNICFDGVDQVVKQKGKLIAIKGNGALDFTQEKKIDYSSKKLFILANKKKINGKFNKLKIFVEVEEKMLKRVMREIKGLGFKSFVIPKNDKLVNGKKNRFIYFLVNKKFDLSYLEKKLDKMEGVIGNGIFSKKNFEVILGKSYVFKKTSLQVALDFIEEKPAILVAKKVKNHADILEIGTPLVKALNERDIIKKIKKFKKEVFVDLKTMDAGYFESLPAIKHGGDYVSVLGVASNSTIKGVLKNSTSKVVVDLIGCKDVVKRVKELKKIGAKNFEIHTGIDEQGRGKNPLSELENISKIPGINIWVAGGINFDSLEKIMQFRPNVVVVGGAITNSKNPGLSAKNIKERIKDLV